MSLLHASKIQPEIEAVAGLAGISPKRLQAALESPSAFRGLALSGDAHKALAALDRFKVLTGRIVEMAEACLPAEVPNGR